MAQTPEGAKKAWETKILRYGEDYGKKSMSHFGKNTIGGFASEKIGKDGLTGKERAKQAGKKGGQNTPTNFKNDPERAKQLSRAYRESKKGETDETSEVRT
jgi:general stress protein YciG